MTSRWRREVSKDISLHSEGKGLVGIQDNRNGNVVIADYVECFNLIVQLQDLMEELVDSDGVAREN